MHHAISRDGTTVAFDRFGGGPTVALVHSGFVDRRIFAPVAAELAKRASVVVMDRRGHGQSGPYAQDHAIEREFEDVAALVEALGEPVVLVGHSLSAWYVLYGARLCEGVKGLVLYEPPPVWIVPEAVVRAVSGAVSSGDVDAAVETLLTAAIGMPAEQVGAMRGSPFWQLVAANAASLAPELEAGRRFHFDAGVFSDFTTRTLLLLGAESPPFVRGLTEQVTAALPNSAIRELAGQGHGALTAAPGLIAGIIGEFATEDADVQLPTES